MTHRVFLHDKHGARDKERCTCFDMTVIEFCALPRCTCDFSWILSNMRIGVHEVRSCIFTAAGMLLT